MLYYQIKVGVKPGSVPENDGASAFDLDSAYRKFNKRAAGVESRMARENGARWALAIVNQSTTTSTLVMVCEVGTDWERLVRSFYAALEVPVISVAESELTQVELERALDESDRMGSYRLQDGDRWVRFGFRDVAARLIDKTSYSEPLSEHLIPVLTRQAVAQKVAALNLASLEAEVGRIYSTRHLQGAGHPVDYLVEAADLTALEQILTPMLAAKYAMGWLASRRYLVVENAHLGLSFSVTTWRHLFATASGGTLVIELVAPLTGSSDALAQLAQLIAEYRDRVLVIFKVPMASRATQAAIRSAMPALLYVAIGFPALTRDGATAYITKQAGIDRLTVDARLTAAVAALAFPTGHQALAAVYAKWRGDTLRQRDFPAYSVVGDTQAARAVAPTESDAAARLAGLIGLTEVKALVNKVVSNFKMAQLRKARKLPVRQASMHMVFTGNPGTAKTTVARLLAQILRDQGVLRVGDLIEVGSADVVSQFVSGTAPQVRALFQRAAGSVLFIDEAYAIVTEHGYGQEAIDTIVQEMENHRDDVLVIFAGYPAEMATFLDANPGLRSRVAYQIPFPDYTIEELVAIARLQLDAQGLRLSDDAPKRLAAALTAIKTQDPKNFGNGRTVRNVLEKAVFNQGLRLDEAGGVPTNAALTELTGADFGDPAARRAQQGFEPARRIGFSAMLQAQ